MVQGAQGCKELAIWTTRRLLEASAATAAIILVLGYLATRPPPRPSAVETIVIATPTAPHTGLLRIAQAKGYFTEEGLIVSIVPALHGLDAISLVAQGKADLASASEVVVAVAITKGEDLGIVANMLSADTMEVVARRDHGISAPADLARKKVGVSFGTAGEYFLWTYLIRHKISPELVSFVDVSPNQIVQALTQGTIDATATWQPIAFNAQSALGKKKAVSFMGDKAYMELHFLAGRRAFLRDHISGLEKLIRALLKAESFNRSAPDEALSLVASRLDIEAKDLRPIWMNFKFNIDLRQSHLATLEDQARWAMARGHAAQGPVPNFLPHLYTDALLAVQPERMTVLR